MPNRCVGESRRIFIIQDQNHFAKSSLPGKPAFSPDPFRLKSEKLTFLIAISHACLLVSRTRTRRRDERARARSTQVPRA